VDVDALHCVEIRKHHQQNQLMAIRNILEIQAIFVTVLQMIAKRDDILRNHLLGLRLTNKNAKYASSTIQNEITDIIGNDIILSDLLQEVKEATFFTILADEVTSHNREELSLCVRFLDNEKYAREEFLGFLNLPRITGETTARFILTFLREVGLDVMNDRGQGYDGAANMSSDLVGVHKRIKDESHKAVYVHCSRHCLKLVIAHSCAVPSVRNAIDKLKACCLFFLASPKREGLLQSIIKNAFPEECHRRKKEVN